MLDECGARRVNAINDAADDYRVETAIIETVRHNRISKGTSNRSSAFRYQTYVVVRFFGHPVRHFKHRQAAEDHDLEVWNDDITDAQHDKSWKVVRATLRLTRRRSARAVPTVAFAFALISEITGANVPPPASFRSSSTGAAGSRRSGIAFATTPDARRF